MKYLQMTPRPRGLRAAATALALATVLAALPGHVPAAHAGAYAAAAGTVVAWGSNSAGQVTTPAGLGHVTAIAAGLRHNLALKADGTVAAWGDNSLGQANVPADLNGVVAIGAGGSHGLALKADGTVVAWGDNHYGQLNVPPGLHDVSAIAAGWVHNLAIKTDGTVVGWGDNSLGQVTIPAGLAGVVAVAAGTSHSLALKADGTVVAWGSSGSGEGAVPAGLSDVVAVSAGYLHSLALKRDGTVVAWGLDLSGMASVPAGLSDVVAVSAGYLHNLALKADGTVVAWGDNTLGQASVPPGLVGARAIAAGNFHSLALVALTSGDTTAPSAAPVLDPPANSRGWNNTDVMVNWNWTDDSDAAGTGAGIDLANCQQQTSVQGESVFNLGATCRDLAGNEGRAAIVLKIDRTAPVFGACPPGGPFATGSGPQTVGPITVDAGISGLDGAASTLTSTVDGGAAGTKEVTFTAADNAGNTAVRSCSYTVAAAPPVEPPACDHPYATVTIQLDANPHSARNLRLWGAFGNPLLDDPAADDGDNVGNAVTYDEVLPGTHNFALALPFGWWPGGVACDPAAQCGYSPQHNSVAATVQACDDVTATFTALRTGSLLVTTFADADGDGVPGGGEPRIGGWWAELTYVDEGGSPRVAASGFDASGAWRVGNLVPGRTYTLCQKPQADWANTLPGAAAADARGWACYTFAPASAEAVEATFGYAPASAAAGTAAGVRATGGLRVSGAVPENPTLLFLPAVAE